jgi:amino acid adenylation domain-containing protein
MIADRAQSITARIAINAARSPHTIAVLAGSTSLTYGELDHRSKKLALLLRRAGAGRDACVGIVCERSAEFVVAALAAMRSGAAYLPIDPALPAARIVSILNDARPIAVVCTTGVSPPSGPWRTVVTDEDDTASAHDDPLPEINLSDLAYVIYTSGSTGTPKGVEITHANLAALICWHEAAFRLSPADRVSQVASVGFDAAVWEIWPSLASGASLHIPNDVTRRSWQALRDWIIAERISLSFIPTPLAEPMISVNWPMNTTLRYMLTGGDTLRRRPVMGLPFKVVNNYGPTECTVVATSGIVDAEGKSVLPSIGRPIAGATVHILDAALRPVPTGEAGELCIAGSLVGRGYRKRADLTAASFVNLTISGEMSRVYRTGDCARALNNGEFAFLGRLDDQVKIRGFRIELGDVDAAVSRLKGIAASTIAVRELGDGGRALVAYIVPHNTGLASAAEFQRALMTQLPDYMVPSFFVRVQSIPMTANGKPDRAALPDPTDDNLLPLTRGAHSMSQSDGTLRQLAGLVASLVGRSVSPDENFFMAGGHSMLGVELVSRIKDAFGVRLTLRQLFASPTVQGIAAEIAQLNK